jgi:hypothetical protein
VQGRKFRRAENILSDTFNESTIVLELGGGVYYEMNGPATEIWNRIPGHNQDPVEADAIITGIAGEFDTESRAELIHFVHDFLIDLDRNKLLIVQGQ